MVGLFVQFAVRVTLVATTGDVLLAEAVHTGAGGGPGGAGCQLTVTLAGVLLPPLLEAVTEYEVAPGLDAVATQLAVELTQPTQT